MKMMEANEKEVPGKRGVFPLEEVQKPSRLIKSSLALQSCLPCSLWHRKKRDRALLGRAFDSVHGSADDDLCHGGGDLPHWLRSSRSPRHRSPRASPPRSRLRRKMSTGTQRPGSRRCRQWRTEPRRRAWCPPRSRLHSRTDPPPSHPMPAAVPIASRSRPTWRTCTPLLARCRLRLLFHLLRSRGSDRPRSPRGCRPAGRRQHPRSQSAPATGSRSRPTVRSSTQPPARRCPPPGAEWRRRGSHSHPP